MLERNHRAALALLLIATFAFATPALAFDQAGFDKATRTILCDCGCHPQSVHECACGRAAEMRGEMRELIESGMTGEQVIAKYVAEHGEQILIAPEATGFNLLAWLGPLAALLIACFGMVWLIRRWQRDQPGEDAEADPGDTMPEPAEDDPYADRLRRQLEKMS